MSTEKVYHLKIRKNTNEEFYEMDLHENTVHSKIINPYFQGGKLLFGGMIIDAADVQRLQIYLTSKVSLELKDIHQKYRHSFKQSTPEPDYSDDWVLSTYGVDVTRNFINSIPEWALKTDRLDASAKILER